MGLTAEWVFSRLVGGRSFIVYQRSVRDAGLTPSVFPDLSPSGLDNLHDRLRGSICKKILTEELLDFRTIADLESCLERFLNSSTFHDTILN